MHLMAPSTRKESQPDAVYPAAIGYAGREPAFDSIAELAAQSLQAPIAVLSLIGEETQWFKARCDLDMEQISRIISFCSHALTADQPLVIADSLADGRFTSNPLVTAVPCIRAYAGVPLRAGNGARIGSLCVTDWTPRHFTAGDIVTLQRLGHLTEELILLRQVASAANSRLAISGEYCTPVTPMRQTAIDYLLNFDMATGLPSRSKLLEEMRQAVHDCATEQATAIVAVLEFCLPPTDIDELGMGSADIVLHAVARHLAHALEGNDMLGRLDGNRLAVMLQHRPDRQVVDALMQIAQPSGSLHKDGQAMMALRCKAGYSVFPEDADSADALLEFASQALQQNQNDAATAVSRYKAGAGPALALGVSLERQLRRAIEQEHLVLHYQPKVSLSTGVITGLEALLRWNHPDHGMIAPSRFIPLAEETGLIVPIGEWVLLRACQQVKRWATEGLPSVPVAVNLSSKQFFRHDVVDTVTRALESAKLEAKFLEIELTESVSMANPELSARHLHQLQEMDVSIAIDDFGTGYSSLSYLKKLPIDKIKIDRSFIADIVDSNESLTIVQAVIAMAHRMNRRVIAEGVETAKQLSFLSINRCDEMQGYYFSKPLSSQDCAHALRTGRKLQVHQPTQAFIGALFGSQGG
jgi:diguanylate cyclase (GGDEF)-like protein